MADKSDAIALDSDSVWAEFTINGITFEVEIYDAQDWLVDIDSAHRLDPNHCLKCGRDHVPDDDVFGKLDDYTCPHCGAQGGEFIRPSRKYLDDVAQLLKDRFGVNRCARQEAAKFYNAIVSSVRDAQKKITLSPGSGSGSTLTQED